MHQMHHRRFSIDSESDRIRTIGPCGFGTCPKVTPRDQKSKFSQTDQKSNFSRMSLFEEKCGPCAKISVFTHPLERNLANGDHLRCLSVLLSVLVRSRPFSCPFFFILLSVLVRSLVRSCAFSREVKQKRICRWVPRILTDSCMEKVAFLEGT